MDWYLVIIWILVLAAFDFVCILVGTIRDNKVNRKEGGRKMIIRKVEQGEDGNIIESSSEINEEENKAMNDDELYMMMSKWIRENFTSVEELDDFEARLTQVENELESKKFDPEKGKV